MPRSPRPQSAPAATLPFFLGLEFFTARIRGPPPLTDPFRFTAAEGAGSPCQDSLQCSATLFGGGYCIKDVDGGRCGCRPGHHYLKGRCWKSSGECRPRPPNPPFLRPRVSPLSSFRSVGLGDNCTQDENCWVGYDFEASVCSAENESASVCKCAPGYYQREHSSCRRKSGTSRLREASRFSRGVGRDVSSRVPPRSGPPRLALTDVGV